MQGGMYLDGHRPAAWCRLSRLYAHPSLSIQACVLQEGCNGCLILAGKDAQQVAWLIRQARALQAELHVACVLEVVL